MYASSLNNLSGEDVKKYLSVDFSYIISHPFSNSNFQNEWSSNIKTTINDEIFEYVTNIDGRKFNKKNINSNISSWYANNFLIRYEYPIKEGDTNVCVLKNMLEELCLNRKVPESILFLRYLKNIQNKLYRLQQQLKKFKNQFELFLTLFL